MRQHSLRLDDELMQAVDSKRGLIPRNTWIVAAIKVALGENLYDGLTDTGPGPQKPGVPEAERSPEPEFQITHGDKSTRARRIEEPAPTPYQPRRVDLTKPPLQRPIVQKKT